MTTLKERIDLERGDQKPSEVHDLILDNATSSGLDVISDEFVNLDFLSLVNCSIASLKGLAKFPKLHRLELSDNQIEDGLDLLVESCPALTHLILSGNKISKLDTLKPLGGLKHLTRLDLMNCPVTEEEDYRSKLFELLPRIVYLDGTNREDEPDEENEDADDDYNDEDVDEEDEEDFDAGNEDEEDEEEEDEEDDGDDAAKRGTKRKHHEEEDDDDDDDGDDDDE